MIYNGSTITATLTSTFTSTLAPSSPTGLHVHVHEHNVHIDAGFIIQEVLLGLITLFAIFGNALVCFTVMKQNQIKHNTWYYLCSLSISDMFVAILNIPLFMYTTFDETIIDKDTILCQLNGFCLVCFFLSSVLTLAVISIHKFLYIRHPLYWRGSNQSLKFIALVWFVSLGIASGPLIGWSNYSHLHGIKQCIPGTSQTTADHSYLSVLIFFGFVLPLTSMVICYTFVYSSTRSHQRRLKRNSISNSKSLYDWGLLKTILIVVVTFCLCWTPFVVYICFSYTKRHISSTLPQIAFICAYAQSAINPVIYALRHDLFREQFKSVICCSTYANVDIARSQSSLPANGPVFTVANPANTKLVHYKKKLSVQSSRPSQNQDGRRSSTMMMGTSPPYGSPCGSSLETYVVSSFPSYDNEVFRLSGE